MENEKSSGLANALGIYIMLLYAVVMSIWAFVLCFMGFDTVQDVFEKRREKKNK